MTIDPEVLTMDTVPDRLAAHGDPWAGIDDDPQEIGSLVDRWHADLAAGIQERRGRRSSPRCRTRAPA